MPHKKAPAISMRIEATLTYDIQFGHAVKAVSCIVAWVITGKPFLTLPYTMYIYAHVLV